MKKGEFRKTAERGRKKERMESRGDSPRSWRDLRASAVVFGGARKNPSPSGYRGEHHRVKILI